MRYVLNMFGKWLDRSGKIIFTNENDLNSYIINMIKENVPFLLQEMSQRKAYEAVRNSYTVIKIDGDSKLKDCFLEKMVVPKPQFSQKEYDARKEAKKAHGLLEVKNQGGSNDTQGKDIASNNDSPGNGSNDNGEQLQRERQTT